jgi:hypothetical protein
MREDGGMVEVLLVHNWKTVWNGFGLARKIGGVVLRVNAARDASHCSNIITINSSAVVLSMFSILFTFLEFFLLSSKSSR